MEGKMFRHITGLNHNYTLITRKLFAEYLRKYNYPLRPTRVHNPDGKPISSAVFSQLTPHCGQAHWRHLVNTIALVHINWRHLANTMELIFRRPAPVHNANGKSIGSAVF